MSQSSRSASKPYGTVAIRPLQQAEVLVTREKAEDPDGGYDCYTFPCVDGVRRRFAFLEENRDIPNAFQYGRWPGPDYEVVVKDLLAATRRVHVVSLDRPMLAPEGENLKEDLFWAHRMAADAARWYAELMLPVTEVRVTRLEALQVSGEPTVVFNYPYTSAQTTEYEFGYQPYSICYHDCNKAVDVNSPEIQKVRKAYPATTVVSHAAHHAVLREMHYPVKAGGPTEVFVFPAIYDVPQSFIVELTTAGNWVLPLNFIDQPRDTYLVELLYVNEEPVKLFVRNLDTHAVAPNQEDHFWAYRQAADAARWYMAGPEASRWSDHGHKSVAQMRVTRFTEQKRPEGQAVLLDCPFVTARVGDLEVEYQPYFYLLPPL